MLAYKLKKVFFRKLVLVIMAIFVFLDIFKIGLIYQNNFGNEVMMYNAKRTVTDQIKGEITNEKLSFVIQKKHKLDKIIQSEVFSTEYNPNTYSGYQYGDWNIFTEIYDSLDYAYHYPNLLQNIMNKATENISLYPSDSYEAMLSQKILNTYQNRRISFYYDTAGYEQYFKYDFSSLLVILLLLLILSPIFAEESELKMNLLILSSPKGKSSLIKSKLSVAVIISAIISLTFSFLDFILFFFIFRLEGANNPLYSIKSFAYTSFCGTIWQYMAISTLMKLFGSVFFAMLFIFFSSLFTSQLTAFICGGGTVFLLIVCYDFSQMQWMKQLNPFMLFTNRLLISSFVQTNLFGIPIDTIALLLGIVLILTIVLFATIIKMQRRNRFTTTHRRKRRILA